MAERLLHAAPDAKAHAKAPAPPTKAPHEDVEAPSGGALGLPVHQYGKPPRPPKTEHDDPQVPVAENPEAPDHETRRPRRGVLGSFFDGLVDG